MTEVWKKEYNHLRPHSALGYKPPAPMATLPSYEVNKIVGE